MILGAFTTSRSFDSLCPYSTKGTVTFKRLKINVSLYFFLKMQGRHDLKQVIKGKDWYPRGKNSGSFLPISRRDTIFFIRCIRSIFLQENRTDQFKFAITHRPKKIGLHNRIQTDSKVP